MRNTLFYLLIAGFSAVFTACNSGASNTSSASISATTAFNTTKQQVTLNSESSITFQSIVAGISSFCALDQQGVIYCWGSGSSSQLGSGKSGNNYVPTPVSNPNHIVFKSLNGFNHNFCALDEVGNAYCWGEGSSGKNGNGTNSNVNTPTLVTMPVNIKFQAVVIGAGTSCALADNGHPYCWGAGESGQIGNGENKNQYVPTEVKMPSTNEIFTELNIAYYSPAFVCGLTNIGNIYCWGYGQSGAIGDGTKDPVKNLPTKVIMPDATVFSHLVPGMGSTACALDNKGVLYCWGYNGHGEGGNGSLSNTNRPTPAIMPDGEVFRSVATSVNTSCAITDLKNTYCWGYDGNGQLGNETIGDNSTIPVMSHFNGRQISKVSSSYHMSSTLCGIDASKRIYCWGYGLDGSIGNGMNQDESVPVPAAFSDPDQQFTDVVISGNSKSTCALSTEGQIYCWGHGLEGQLGNGIAADSNTPSLVIITPAILQLVSSANFLSGTFCALHSNNNIYCWGYGADGQLGNGQDQNESTPVKVKIPTNHKITQLLASSSSFCGLDESGQAFCWGYGADGQLGNDKFLNSNLPVEVSMPYSGSSFLNLVASADSWCALDKSGMIYCWGYGSTGQIGNNEFNSKSLPTPVKLPAGVNSFKTLYADRANTICAIANTNELYCWGSGNYGQIGNKSNGYNNAKVPTKVDGGLKFDYITAAFGTFCGINHSDYRSYCWGAGNYGQIGNWQLANQNTPIGISGMAPLVNILGSDSSFCAKDINNSIYCWGRGDLGQVGNGLMYGTNTFPSLIKQPSGGAIVNLAASASDTFCGLTATLDIYCWGAGTSGQLGNSTLNNSGIPTKVSSSNNIFASDLGAVTLIRAATDNFCLLNSLGHVYCWGDGFSGENGSGDNQVRTEPTPLMFNY